MTLQRMEHVGIVVDDLAAATEFFVELGLELRGEGPVEGHWVDRVVGLDGVRAEIAMLQTPHGHGPLELTKFHTPSTQSGDWHAPANTPGIRHVAFAVEDIDAVVAGLRARGGELVGDWRGTRRATGSATSAARRGSSSNWQSGSANRPSRPTCDQASVIRVAFRTRILVREVGLAPRSGRMVTRTGRCRR